MSARTKHAAHAALDAIWDSWRHAKCGYCVNCNEAGGTSRVIPPMRPDEAVLAVQRLLRSEGVDAGRFEWKVASGRRYTWARGREFSVNPERGWQATVHLVSHWICRRRLPDERPHSRRHATIEARMIRVVIERGWLDGSLRQEIDERVEKKVTRAMAQRMREASTEARLSKVRARIKKWETRLKLATTKLRKLKARERGLVRSAAKSTVQETAQ